MPSETETTTANLGRKQAPLVQPSIKVDDVSVEDKSEDKPYEAEARILRRNLRLYFYAAFKWKGSECSFHLVYCLIFLLQIIKVSLLTAQMFDFGHDRANFSSVVNRGHITLRHLLLKDWDASWETLPYPPAHGDFAVYTINDWENGINYALNRYYNAENVAIGYYKQLPGDRIDAIIRYFDFPGFKTSRSTDGLHIYDQVISLENHKNNINITTIFESYNISEPFKRMLSVSLHFTIHSVRSHVENRLATCLLIEGWVNFFDEDNNGQVNVGLVTETKRIKCKRINLTLSDWSLDDTSTSVGGTLLAFCFISLLITVLTLVFAVFVCLKTKQFMKKYYKMYYGVIEKDETDLPASEYFRFAKLWDFVSLIADILTIYATIWIVFKREESDWLLETFDSHAVWLGIACVMAWLSLLRFFKFHNKFHLLFSTLYRAFWDVLAYLLCVAVLFVGFWVCGYVVMGPYHVKFQTPASAAETLFSIINGDEIYATLAILEGHKSGGGWVHWFSRFYIGAYVAIFTIVVINLLIALFMSAYEAIKEKYDEKPEERDLGHLEKALRQFLIQQPRTSSLRTSIHDLLSEDVSTLSKEETELRKAMGALVRISKVDKSLMFLRPRTLKAFMEDGGSGRKPVPVGCCTCAFATFTDQNRQPQCSDLIDKNPSHTSDVTSHVFRINR